ncbi:sensor histidine kinase [Inhella proteolytica]|uniref:Histidine kinase n=1 Tax=Inhella proteolytica TaxID=2795029 RepID=A0A931NF05_9BURK|nr:histidine kinase [Inhella proteolytica]MBH9575566.1 histidine kinase [Inhella proteolytica]
MNTLFSALQLARQDFFKLRKHRAAPAWAMWLMTGLVSLGWGVGLLALIAVLGRRWDNLDWLLAQAPPFFASTFIVGAVFHVVFTLIEQRAPQGFLDWVNGEPGLCVSLFYGLVSMFCVGLGLGLSYLLIGQIPGMEKAVWTPQRSWWSFALVSIFASVLWGLWAWQQWHEEQLRRQAKEAELRLLQAQIEPHYLFNTLANVRSLIDFDPPAAGQLLDAFTDHLRVSLTSMRAETVPLERELELVGHYLRLMQLRMGDRMSFHIEADPELGAVAVPPLLLQPLVENAIHHGLECCIDAGMIEIRAERRDGLLVLSVRDNGVGLDAPKKRKGAGVATQNIRERLASRYGERARLVLQSAPPRGTLATLEIPLPTP